MTLSRISEPRRRDGRERKEQTGMEMASDEEAPQPAREALKDDGVLPREFFSFLDEA